MKLKSLIWMMAAGALLGVTGCDSGTTDDSGASDSGTSANADIEADVDIK